MDHVASGGYEMVGTFNGNPLAMAAARAMLTEVATEAAYRRIEGLRQRAAAGISAAIEEFGLNGGVVTAGAKGCVVFGAGAGQRLPRASSPSTTRSATRTGCSSTTAGCSCRPGARSSSG